MDRTTLAQPSSAAGIFTSELSAIGRHLNTAVLQTLVEGPLRFNEIVEQFTHVASDRLSAGLRELDECGLVGRRVDPGPPLRVLYEVTASGLELAPALRAITQYAEGAG